MGQYDLKLVKDDTQEELYVFILYSKESAKKNLFFLSIGTAFFGNFFRL